ncbi:MAG: hypothetical protein ABJP45_11730 [Cyclobacteriaceae bacterium]
MRDKLFRLALFFSITFSACKEDAVPQGLYNYQVERLLSGDTAKTWVLVSSVIEGSTTTPVVCTDSLRLLITAVATDSINVATLTPQMNCTAFDTLDLGDANASGDLVFTDSIVFDSGEIWIVTEITSQNLSLSVDASIMRYNAK